MKILKQVIEHDTALTDMKLVVCVPLDLVGRRDLVQNLVELFWQLRYMSVQGSHVSAVGKE